MMLAKINCAALVLCPVRGALEALPVAFLAALKLGTVAQSVPDSVVHVQQIGVARQRSAVVQVPGEQVSLGARLDYRAAARRSESS